MVWNATSNGWSWDPWRELSELHAQFDRAFGGSTRVAERRAAAGMPPIELWSHERGLRLCAQVPGVAADAIEVSVDGDVLTIKGSRKEPEAMSFARSVRLPFAVDGSASAARVEKGVLEVDLPRSPSEMPRKITVKPA